jgi:hypothetical protein
MNLQIPGCVVELLRDDAIEIEIFHRLLPRQGTVTLLDVIFEYLYEIGNNGWAF